MSRRSWISVFLRDAAQTLAEAAMLGIESLQNRLRPTCRRVIGRALDHAPSRPARFVTAYCDDPTVPVCGLGYCLEHHMVLCRDGCSGPDGDEDDPEPPVTLFELDLEKLRRKKERLWS